MWILIIIYKFQLDFYLGVQNTFWLTTPNTSLYLIIIQHVFFYIFMMYCLVKRSRWDLRSDLKSSIDSILDYCKITCTMKLHVNTFACQNVVLSFSLSIASTYIDTQKIVKSSIYIRLFCHNLSKNLYFF